MSDLERVLARLVADAGFADAVREHPLEALRGYALDDDALRRLEAVLGGTVTLDRLLSGPARPRRAPDAGRRPESPDVSA